MNKKIITLLILSIIFSCVPINTFGQIINVEATIKIQKILIPGRAAVNKKNIYNYNFGWQAGGGYTVSYGSTFPGTVVKSMTAYGPGYETGHVSIYNNPLVISFEYDSTNAPYSINLELSADELTVDKIFCDAECNSVSGTSWYRIYWEHDGYDPDNTLRSWNSAPCPSVICNSDWPQYIAVESTHVYSPNPAIPDYFEWRYPLFCLSLENPNASCYPTNW